MSESRTFVVIPTRAEVWDTTVKLIKDCKFELEVTKVFVLDNSVPQKIVFLPSRGKEETLWMGHFSLYEMWNRMWDYIQHNYKGEKNIAFLNDDIEIPPHALATMAHKLRSDPTLAAVYPDVNANWLNYIMGSCNMEKPIEYSNGTSMHNGGLLGYCFMVKGELDLRVDENLKLYWGDDDLSKQIFAKGYRIGKIKNLPIKHIGGATTRSLPYGEWEQIMESDRRYFNQKYHENRSPVIR